MAIAQVKITYKQLINAQSKAGFEKDIFNTSYNEFLIKSRIYNSEGKFRTFTQMQKNDERASNLHYKLSKSIMQSLLQLNGYMPELTGTLGEKIAFDTPEIKLIESDVQNQSAHCISIAYTTSNLILHNYFSEYLILSVPANGQDSRKEEANTFMLKMQPNLAITGYLEYKNRVASDFTGFAAN